ncbi:hypothetical protein PMAYCL1PPCAC_18026 [Pristionchus mayeri]|uniref:Neurotransmitter-gated ion-channel ligand-binding domain-containing protein n=1 Tax=Pristionchus mayeri TaxID=1317129 RepID=A0AAN5CNQ2_9BILA|nr:hypothetical protein PMAYCL1PPCAC_18026 [Pristionchus mayeri]
MAMGGYNKSIAPFQFDSTPLDVQVAMIIEQIVIRDLPSRFDLQLTLIQSWKDSRLSTGLDPLILTNEEAERIWTPMSTLKGWGVMMNRKIDRIMELSEDGRIRLTERIETSFIREYSLKVQSMLGSKHFFHIRNFPSNLINFSFVFLPLTLKSVNHISQFICIYGICK